MQNADYLQLLVDYIHSATLATIGADGHPQTRIIDMMLWDEQGVYFLTAKGKVFLHSAYGAGICSAIGNERKNCCFAAGKNKEYR